MLGNIAGQDALTAQAATPKKLARWIGRVQASQLRKRPGPRKWSVRDILAHLADCEQKRPE